MITSVGEVHGRLMFDMLKRNLTGLTHLRNMYTPDEWITVYLTRGTDTMEVDGWMLQDLSQELRFLLADPWWTRYADYDYYTHCNPNMPRHEKLSKVLTYSPLDHFQLSPFLDVATKLPRKVDSVHEKHRELTKRPNDSWWTLPPHPDQSSCRHCEDNTLPPTTIRLCPPPPIVVDDTDDTDWD